LVELVQPSPRLCGRIRLANCAPGSIDAFEADCHALFETCIRFITFWGRWTLSETGTSILETVYQLRPVNQNRRSRELERPSFARAGEYGTVLRESSASSADRADFTSGAIRYCTSKSTVRGGAAFPTESIACNSIR
jgi:hypothetical protein